MLLKRIFLIYVLSLSTSAFSAPADTRKGIKMTPDVALALVKQWCKTARCDMRKMTVRPNGDFAGVFGAAEIKYRAADQAMMVLGLVFVDASLLLKAPALFEKLKRVGDREKSTLGGGYFFIDMEPYEIKTPTLNLRQDYAGTVPAPEDFVARVDSLMEWSTYWRKQRYPEVGDKTEEELIREAPDIESWVLEKRRR